MDAYRIITGILKGLLKLIFKASLAIIWGVLSITEAILHHINDYLKKINS